MNFLSVNSDDFLLPLNRRLSRSVSPLGQVEPSSPNNSHRQSGTSTPDLSRFSYDKNSTTRLDRAEPLADLTRNSNLKLNKSSENLCSSRAKKKLHRRAHITEAFRPRCYTDPGEEKVVELEEIIIPVPILRMPSHEEEFRIKPQGSSKKGSSALNSLIQQTLNLTTASVGLQPAGERRLSQPSSTNLNKDAKQNFSRSTSSVSTLAYPTPDTSMAPLQTHAETQSVTCLNTLEKDTSPVPTQRKQHKRHHSHQLSITSQSSGDSAVHNSCQSLTTATKGSKADARTLRTSSNSLSPPIVPLSQSASTQSISPRKIGGNNSSNTAKHEQATAVTASSAVAALAATSAPEKEKKRKEMSSSRVKKFQRHFAQVSKDEKLINYFSCALVSDILLQGHLYITDQHFAFYSNVFGYVTKVVIPTSSVTKISKEKTAKIIPNAVGVATADERHVFGSFISREAAFRLMCSVCLPQPETVPIVPVDVEISEEYSIEDDSSCSISGNESPPQAKERKDLALAEKKALLVVDDSSQTLLRRSVGTLSFSSGDRESKEKLRLLEDPNVAIRASAPPTAFFSKPPTSAANLAGNSRSPSQTTSAAASAATNITMIIAGTASSTSASSTPTPSNSSSPVTVVSSTPKSATDSLKILTKHALLRLKFPTELHIVYLGVFLSLVLALFSVFLLYRILNIEAKTSLYNSPLEFNWRPHTDEDIFGEALRWQKELQTKSTEEAQTILHKNLEQIAKVRRSLETLSMLIHDRSSAFGTATHEDGD